MQLVGYMTKSPIHTNEIQISFLHAEESLTMYGETHDIESEGLDRKMERNRPEFSERDPLLRGKANTTSQIAVVGANVGPIESLDYE